ncbi:MAG: hypothetical protein FJY95_01645 [Candidatus Handelsmanbacteria bacterium]|nr:hypothetical protein [Candidatus Handelsmanbacteria bacterium]
MKELSVQVLAAVDQGQVIVHVWPKVEFREEIPSSFAWVIPVPTRPRVKPCNGELFEYGLSMTEPSY